jgi:hypothetical protein
MSCRRISRELIERFRFGEELDGRSAPHLTHLAACQWCRDEVGLDRTLVLQLQRALRARVAGHEPSPRAFNAVRIRAMADDTPEALSARFVRWIRFAPAGAAVGLMLVAVVTAGIPKSGAFDSLEARSVPWPGLMERVDNGPLTPKEGAWWLKYQPSPPIRPPATGVIASVDPNPLDEPIPLPKPATGLTE